MSAAKLPPEQTAERLRRIADQIDGARHLVVAGRMAVDKTHSNSTDAEEGEALCELLYAIGGRLTATAATLREVAHAA